MTLIWRTGQGHANCVLEALSALFHLQFFIQFIEKISFTFSGFGDRLLHEIKKLAPKDIKIRVYVLYVFLGKDLKQLLCVYPAFMLFAYCCNVCFRRCLVHMFYFYSHY